MSKNTQRNLILLTESIQEVLDSPQAQPPNPLLPFLQRAQLALLHQASDQAITESLSAIQRDIKKQQAFPATKSWAQAAAQIQPIVPSPPPMRPQEAHTVSIKMGNTQEREATKGMTNQELRAKIGPQKAVAVIKLPSGDIRVAVHSGAEKSRLEEDQSWIQELWPQATVAKPSFRVLVHGVRVGWDLNQATSRAKIQEENLRWHPSLRVDQAMWLKSEKAREGQRHSSAILAVQSESQVKEIVAKGLVLEGTLLTAEAYHPQQRVVQCFKCNQFGHTSAYCKEEGTVCGTCAGQHRTSECKSGTAKCSNCKGNHASWAKACKVKQAAIAKAKAFSANFRAKWAHQRTPQLQEGWTQVTNKKRKGPQMEQPQREESPAQSNKPPGKPKGSTATIMAGRRQVNKLTFPGQVTAPEPSQGRTDGQFTFQASQTPQVSQASQAQEPTPTIEIEMDEPPQPPSHE